MLRPKEGRVDSIRALISRHRQECKLNSGDAKTLRGRIIHHAGTCAGRVGKGILHYVNERAAGSSPSWSEELHFNLEFLDIIFSFGIHRSISIIRGRKSGVRLWTDASSPAITRPRCTIRSASASWTYECKCKQSFRCMAWISRPAY